MAAYLGFCGQNHALTLRLGELQVKHRTKRRLRSSAVASPERANERRRHGQGSITETAPGVWRLRVLVGIDVLTQHPIQRSRTFRGTRAGAERAMTSFRAELVDVPVHTQQPATRQLLSDVVRAHLTASTFAPGTRRSYESAFRLHIEQGFGRRRIDTITAPLMRDYYRALNDQKGLSASSVWSIYSLISGSLRRAAKESGLRFDFNQLVTPPKPTAEKQQLASDKELVAAFAAAAELGDGWPLLLRLACATGMRRGELVALRWSSLDARDTLHVAKAISDDKGGSIEKAPKNGHARYVAIDSETVRRWHHRRHETARWCDSSGLQFTDARYVFTANPEGSLPQRPDRVTGVWDKIRTSAGLNSELEFRALRNWHVTVLDDELGFDLAKIGRRVGHSRSDSSATGMTARYSLRDRKVDADMAHGIGTRLASIERHALTMRLPLGDR
jgi:integrase